MKLINGPAHHGYPSSSVTQTFSLLHVRDKMNIENDVLFNK